MRFIISISLFIFSFSIIAEQKIVNFDKKVHSFIKDHCIKCHGPEKDKGDRVLHTFPVKTDKGWGIDLTNDKTIHLLKDVLDQLNLGEMPPRKKSITQPPLEDVRHAINWLTDVLSATHTEEGKSVIRRLNRDEYRNTMISLIGINPGMFDPTSQFPDDDKVEGFTNISQALNLSDEHLDQYLQAAEKYLDMAIHWGPKPQEKTKDLKPKDWGYPSKEKRTPWMYRLYKPGKYLDVGCGLQPISENIGLATYPKSIARKGIEQAGFYRLNISAEAIRRLSHPYDPKMIPTDLSRSMQLAIYVAKSREGLTAGGENTRQRIAIYELKDDVPQNFQVNVWLNKGSIPFVNWENGPGPSDWWMRDICKKYHTDIEFRGKEGAHAWHVVGKDLVPGRTVSDVWKGPVMRIHKFQFTGPLKRTFQSKFQKEILGGIRDPQKVNTTSAIQKLATLAFRKDVSEEEIKPYIAILNKAENELGMDRKESLKLAFKSILVSPQFLFLRQKADKDGNLNNSAIADRLSYFLRRSMPDDKLLSNTSLSSSALRRIEAERLLSSDANTSRLIHDFMNSWLRYDKFGVMAPDKIKYQEYYRWGLKKAMRAETTHYIQNALEENRPISEFLDSSYTFLNNDLARHYGIKGVKGLAYRKVELPKDSIRGGLLGHAGILSLSSNGVDTSPVIRGIWVLENILGTPPSPPPPDVEALDPDTRGAVTLKQRLEKHRKVEACADCHAKIDPFGFALENFDPIGSYRTMYHKKVRWNRNSSSTFKSKGPKVDGSSVLPSGEKINDLNDLKKALYNRRAQFAMALTEKLMTFASGREMTFKEHAELKRIASLKPAEEYGFRDLILEVVSSDVFIKR